MMCKDLTTLKETVNQLNTTLNLDYGPDNIFLALKDSCISSKTGQYVYRMCFYGQATQDKVNLGTWDSVVYPKDDKDDKAKSTIVKFLDGAKCWNGPKRSLTVTLKCGVTEELFDIDEPETCVYTAFARLPALCNTKELDSVLNRHDEL